MLVSEMNVKTGGFSEYVRLDPALEMIFSRIKEVKSEEMSFDEAADRVLSKELKSKLNVPPFDRSAMDGFAVRAEDTFGADENEPRHLQIIGSIEIGSASDLEVGRGQAVEIATGAPMPEGTDATVMVEKTSRENDKIKVFEPVSPGENVSSAGEDVKSGQKVLEADRRLRPSDIGMLASTGNLKIQVKRKPRIGIAITGDELRKPGKSLKPGEITESVSYILFPAVEKCGSEAVRLGIVPDRFEEIEKIFNNASDFDALILTGGSSVGKKDLVPDAISKSGELVFHGVAIRPGSPSSFGVVDGTPVFSLAGFPVASVIAFEMIVRPALRAMQGLQAKNFRKEIKAKLLRKISSSLGRMDVARVRLKKDNGDFFAEPIRVTGSSVLRTVTEADGLVTIPENSEGFSEGEVITVYPLDL